MKYYSDITKRLFDTQEECMASEKEFLEAKNKRENEESSTKAELEDLYQKFNEENAAVNAAMEARAKTSKELQNKIAAFSRKYGYIPENLRAFNIFTWLMP